MALGEVPSRGAPLLPVRMSGSCCCCFLKAGPSSPGHGRPLRSPHPRLGHSESKHAFNIFFQNVNRGEILHPSCCSIGTKNGWVPSEVRKSQNYKSLVHLCQASCTTFAGEMDVPLGTFLLPSLQHRAYQFCSTTGSAQHQEFCLEVPIPPVSMTATFFPPFKQMKSLRKANLSERLIKALDLSTDNRHKIL